jgi:glycosyltransferase A (GT-A) superfamily protein (DUF2064 family)
MCLLKDTIRKVSHSDAYEFIVVVNSNEEAKLFENTFNVKTYVLNESVLQRSQSERFTFLFSKFKEKFSRVALIPGDVPSISEETLVEGFKLLKNQKFVFGPEYNGGVYFIGMSTQPDNLFYGVRWSTRDSLRDLISNSQENCRLLDFKEDINTVADLINFKQDIQSGAPATYKLLLDLRVYGRQMQIGVQNVYA